MAATFPQLTKENQGWWAYVTRFVTGGTETQTVSPDNLMGEKLTQKEQDPDELMRQTQRVILLQALTLEYEKIGRLEEIRIGRLDLELFAPPCAVWKPSNVLLTEYIVTSPFPAISFNEWYAQVVTTPQGFIFFNTFKMTASLALESSKAVNDELRSEIAKKWATLANPNSPKSPPSPTEIWENENIEEAASSSQIKFWREFFRPNSRPLSNNEIRELHRSTTNYPLWNIARLEPLGENAVSMRKRISKNKEWWQYVRAQDEAARPFVEKALRTVHMTRADIPPKSNRPAVAFVSSDTDPSYDR